MGLQKNLESWSLTRRFSLEDSSRHSETCRGTVTWIGAAGWDPFTTFSKLIIDFISFFRLHHSASASPPTSRGRLRVVVTVRLGVLAWAWSGKLTDSDSESGGDKGVRWLSVPEESSFWDFIIDTWNAIRVAAAWQCVDSRPIQLLMSQACPQ